MIPIAISWLEAGRYAYDGASSGPAGAEVFLRWWRLLEVQVQANGAVNEVNAGV